MPNFRYEAIDPHGVRRRGVMDAPNEAALIEKLRAAGNLPVRAVRTDAATTTAAPPAALTVTRQRLARQEATDAIRELAVMLGAGQDLDAALRFLVETAPNRRVGGVLDDIRGRVRDGAPLADALARHPASFPPTIVGLVRAGEAASRLADTLARLATMLERQRRLAASLQSALIYPALLLVAAIGSIAVILGWVLPQFASLFAQSGASMPGSTRLMMQAGDWIAANWTSALLILLSAGLAFRTALRWRPFRRSVDALLLGLPVVGPLMREVLAARMTRSLGTLLGNGVPLMSALALLRDVVGNLAALDALDRAAASAREGGGLARPLADSSVFPARTIHLLRLGEEHAQLGPMALHAAEIHEDRVERGAQRLVALLVPIITIVMGTVIAAIVASLLQAMLGLNDLAA